MCNNNKEKEDISLRARGGGVHGRGWREEREEDK